MRAQVDEFVAASDVLSGHISTLLAELNDPDAQCEEIGMIDAVEIGIAIGGADAALKQRNLQAQTPPALLLCGAYAWVLATVECSIREVILGVENDGSGAVYRAVLDQKNQLLGSNTAMIEIIKCEPAGLCGDADDWHTELRTLDSAESIDAMMVIIGRITEALMIADCTPRTLQSVIVAIGAHIAATACLQCQA